jgi:RNA recognition motif-containing protein
VEPSVIRSNFKKAVNAARTGLDSIFRAWIDFEQENGSVADFSFAWSSAATKLKTYTLFPPQNPETALKRTLPSDQPAKRRKTSQTPKEKPSRKRDQKPAEDGLSARDRELQTIFVSNISFTADQQSLRDTFAEYKPKDIRLVPSDGGQGHRGVAFIEFSNQVDANNALKLDNHLLNNRPIKVAPSNNQQQGLGQRKSQMVFVTNLPYEVTPDELRVVFSPAGAIADIRIPLDSEKAGKNRGFAYVEFVQSEGAIKALGMDKTEIKKRKINVEPYIQVPTFLTIEILLLHARPNWRHPRPHGSGPPC